MLEDDLNGGRQARDIGPGRGRLDRNAVVIGHEFVVCEWIELFARIEERPRKFSDRHATVAERDLGDHLLHDRSVASIAKMARLENDLAAWCRRDVARIAVPGFARAASRAAEAARSDARTSARSRAAILLTRSFAVGE